MWKIAVLGCAFALAACASSKSSEPHVANASAYDGASAERATVDDERATVDEGESRAGDEAPVAGDNTGVNERDRDSDAPTPMDQGESERDLEITQSIRKAVMDDESLSFTAKNVKIITQDGKVTLRGPVKSAQERTAIGVAAKRFADGVDNQLDVVN